MIHQLAHLLGNVLAVAPYVLIIVLVSSPYWHRGR